MNHLTTAGQTDLSEDGCPERRQLSYDNDIEIEPLPEGVSKALELGIAN